jgi:carboxylesterase type B
MATTLKTTALGDIQGRDDDGVVQYLGIKYATLKDRFADAELISERPASAGVLDATKDG